MLKVVLERYHRRRFAWLFFSLLLTIGVNPVFEVLTPGFNPRQFFLRVNLRAAHCHRA